MIKEIKQEVSNHLANALGTKAKVVTDDTGGRSGKTQVVSDYTVRVGYASAAFDPSPDIEMVGLQEGRRSFWVKVEIKDLRNEDYATDLLELIEQNLIGYQPKVRGVIGDIYLQSDNFQRIEAEKIYFYLINFAVPCEVQG